MNTWLARSLMIVLASLLLVGCRNNEVGIEEISEEPLSTVREMIRMNNCGGRANSEQTSERSRTISFDGELKIGIEAVMGQVSAKYAESKDTKKSQKLIAPAGTNMQFELIWTEQSWFGNVTSGGRPQGTTYRVSVPVAVELVSSRDLGCEGNRATEEPVSEPGPKVPRLIFPTTRERISFTPGSTSYTIATTLTRDTPKGYVLRILAGQQMTILAPGAVTIAVLDTGDRPMALESVQAGQWKVDIPHNGDYTVVVSGAGDVNVAISIPPP